MQIRLECSLRTHPTFAESDIEQAIEYAKQEFRLGSPDDPNSQRSQLLSVEKQLGKTPKELENLLELPTSCETAWMWFWDLSSCRTEGFSGRNPIAYSEIKAYFELLKIDPIPVEIALIKRLDNVYLSHQANKK